VSSKAKPAAIFDLKSASLGLEALMLKTPDVGLLAQALQERFGDAGGLFDNDPVLIDLAALGEVAEAIDFVALVDLLRRHRMQPVAVRAGSAEQRQAAVAAGLALAGEAVRAGAPAAPPVVLNEVIHEVVREVVREVPAAPAPTLVVDKPLRSGQQVYARGGDLVVLAAVSFGAEVIADGHIHVYAPLRGRALAGAGGNTAARIFASSMEPQLVSIAGLYRAIEDDLAPDVLRKPAQARLLENKLVFEPLGR
jgi:septum site-determining protein MinC